MKTRKRTAFKRVDLSCDKTKKMGSENNYDPEEDYSGGFSLEELEELGVISYPKTRKTIPDGESEFHIAFKQGEDF